MKKATIYHLQNALFRGFDLPQVIYNKNCYNKVAEISTDDVDLAYELSQSTNSTWTNNPQVAWTSDAKLRSTSVGDIIIIDNIQYLCKNVGWSRVEVVGLEEN